VNNRTLAMALLAASLGLGASARADEKLDAAVSLYQQGKFSEAEAALRDAPGAEAKGYLAAALAKQKKYDDAVAAANAALADAPTHELAVAGLGEALVGQKKYDEAVEKLSEVIKKADVPYAYYWRGQAYYNKKQADRMVADYEMFLKLAPKAPEAKSVEQLLSALK
jgi:tetratricopeptide (TPR) repeat protein